MASTVDSKPVVTGYPAPAEQHYPTSNTAGAAYPYPPPPYYPPPPPPQPYYNPYSNIDNSSARRCLRFFIIACIVFFVVSGVVTLITWLVLRPQIPQFSISSASVSGFNLSANQLSSNFNVNISVVNPNKKMGIYYDNVQADVLYRYDTIASTSLPPFWQSKRNSTVVPAKFAVLGGYVTGGDADAILMEKGSEGVNFGVRVYSVVTFRTGSWRTRRRGMMVYCDHVRIGFSNVTASVGSLVGGPTQCRVDL